MTFDALLRGADVIVVTAATTDTSRGMFDEAAFRRVVPGVVFINVARGALLDEAALLGALEDGRVSWACLDVRRNEPARRRDPLLRHPRVISTPHIGAKSIEAAHDLNRGVADIGRQRLEESGRIKQVGTPPA